MKYLQTNKTATRVRTAPIAALTAIIAVLLPGLSQAAPPTTVYAGTATGIVQSTDGGTHWSTLATFGTGVYALAIDPTNANNIYAGVFNAVYKSTDGGNHWTEETNGINTSSSTVTTLAIDPSNPSTIYAGTGVFGDGVYKSTDSGVHWTAVNSGLITNGSLDVGAPAIDPSNTGTLYVTGNTGLSTSKTTNGGGSWTPLPGSIPFGSAAAVDPVNTGTVYLAGYPGVTVTTTGGGNPPAAAAWKSFLSTAPLIESLVIDPSNHGTVYAGAGGCNVGLTICQNSIYKATNGVFSATPIGALTAPPATSTLSVHALAVDPANPSTLYAGSEDGVHQSTNGGVTWSLVYSIKDISALAMKPNGSQGMFFNEVEAGAKELFTAIQNLNNTTLSCDILQAYEEEVQLFVDFDLLSATQGQALIAQAQAVAASIPCK